MKLDIWSPDKAKEELAKRLNQAKEARKKFEPQWLANEKACYATDAFGQSLSGNNSSLDLLSFGAQGGDPQSHTSNLGISYIMKNVRFVHSQLSANPPSVVPRPTTNDAEDKRRADAAERIKQFALRQYNLQEKQDLTTLSTCVYGTGFLKSFNDPTKGDLLEFDEASGEMIFEGDISIQVPSIWAIYPDPDSSEWYGDCGVRYVFEEIILPYDKACYLFPDKKEELDEVLTEDSSIPDEGHTSLLKQNETKGSVVKVFQYWEKGSAVNGFQGRFCWCLADGTLLTEVMPNPHAFSRRKKISGEVRKLPRVAHLPYHILTDIDVPGSYWGQSPVSFAAPIQEMLQRIDNLAVDNLMAHGVARLILPEGAEVADDSITNSTWDVVKVTGGNGNSIHFQAPLQVSPEIPRLREQMRQAIDEVFGINESHMGVQKREMSGASMQYATNQGNLIRRRLFNKYVLLVENLYKDIFKIAVETWTDGRTISTLGKEQAFEVVDVKSTDIESGYDFQSEYGTSLSLDPMARKEEILTLAPLLEKAGVSPRQMLGMLKLAQLDNLYDRMELSERRQREIFDEMISKNIYIEPEEMSDHKPMLEFALTYVMTSEYKYLAPESKTLIRKHIKAREELAAQTPGAADPAAAGGVPEGSVPQQAVPQQTDSPSPQNLGDML